MKTSILPQCLAVACLLAASVHAQTTAPAPVQAQAREVVTSAEQLPRRTIKLDKLPSQYLSAPRAEVQVLADALERNVRADLARYDIRDPTTLRAKYSSLSTLAQLKGDWAAVRALSEQIRALQDKPGPRATTGLLPGILSEQQTGEKDAAWVQAEVTKRYGALNWTDVADSVKSLKGQFELLNPELVRGAFEQQIDVAARNTNMEVSESIVGTILAARLQQELMVPLKGAIVAGLAAVIDQHAVTVAKPDLWTPRTFALAPDAKAQPVGVAIWDSGVDLRFFKSLGDGGIGFTADHSRTSDLLLPLGKAEPRWPQLQQLVKGSMDLQAALDTEDARMLKQVIGSLKAEQAKTFSEDITLATLYMHGTHVAGIASAGNPFARIYSATMHMNHTSVPELPTKARSQALAQAYRDTVKAFQANGVRVVNMSWRYGANRYEGALAWHNVGKDAETRKQMARELFAIERDALRAAIASAPEILFIAGSGNENNNADFEEYIPAGFELPNLITTGAVDQTGKETSFSTFGRTVVLHANGDNVESLVPGGAKMKLSGTSMASPQVANLAAKLFALKSKATVAEVKQAMLSTAERDGRVNLLHPRKAAEALGLKP